MRFFLDFLFAAASQVLKQALHENKFMLREISNRALEDLAPPMEVEEMLVMPDGTFPMVHNGDSFWN